MEIVRFGCTAVPDNKKLLNAILSLAVIFRSNFFTRFFLLDSTLIAETIL